MPYHSFWKNTRVLVTGGTGFIGSHLVDILLAKQARVSVIANLAPSTVEYLDLSHPLLQYFPVNLLSSTRSLVERCRNQDVILHLAARVAGIGFNSSHPATMLHDNLTMTLNVFEAARMAGARKIQFVSSACVYPRYCSIPTPETEGMVEEPEPTNYGYGWAKRMGEILAKTYAQEYGLEVSIVRPYNAYGPRDDFDPKTSHVIPSLIKRVVEEEDPVVVWGDGTPTRSFLFVEDFARGLLEAMERYPVPDPLNLGSSEEITIKDLVSLIIKLSGRKTKIRFDKRKPNGQPRRNCDTRKAWEKIGFVAKIPLKEGLRRTIRWYQRER